PLDRLIDGYGRVRSVFYRFGGLGNGRCLGDGRCGRAIAVRRLGLVAFFLAPEESCHRFDDRGLVGRGSIARRQAAEYKVLPNRLRWLGFTGTAVTLGRH